MNKNIFVIRFIKIVGNIIVKNKVVNEVFGRLIIVWVVNKKIVLFIRVFIGIIIVIIIVFCVFLVNFFIKGIL